MQTNPAAFFSLFPSLVAPFTTLMTSLTSPPGRLARWLGVEAEVEGGKSSPLRFLFPPRGRRKPSDVFFFLDSGAGSPLSSRFSRFSLPVSASPRHATERTATTSLLESRQAREKEGEAKAKREYLFSPFRCPCFPRRDRLARRAFFLPPSIDPLAFSRRLPPPPLPSQPPPPTHSHQTGKSPRSTAAPREPPRRTSLLPSWSAKSRPTG